MNTLIANLQVRDDFFAKYPTLAAQRRALGTNGRLANESAPAQHIGKIIYEAGTKFLESIHEEINNAKPQWQKDAEAADQLALANENATITETIRPELTADYLIALGIPTSLSSMSGREPTEIAA